MERTSLDDIKKKVEELALKINAANNMLPTYGYSRDFGYPHIEVDNKGLHYVVIERGEELDRKTTNDLDDLLYWIFADVTFTMSTAFELKNRIKGKDCRRAMFDKQEELLGVLNSNWREREIEEHKRILINNPFDDLSELRAIYCGQLRQQGHSETEIRLMAYAKYPRN